MKPPPFAYVRPDSVDAALSALTEHGSDAAILAGGHSLVPLLNLRLARPDVVVDINRVPGLDTVQVGPDAVRVGALVRAATLEHHEAARDAVPVLSEALGNVAHPQIRNRTTIGGNIAHSDPASELPAVLAALDGSVTLTSERGQRDVVWSDYLLGLFYTSREPDELLTGLTFPVHEGWTFGYSEVARRRGDYPIVGLCAGLRIVDGAIAGARLAGVSVAERTVRLPATEAALVGLATTDDRGIHEAAAQARDEVNPTDDLHGTVAYRRALLVSLVRRQVAELVKEAGS